MCLNKVRVFEKKRKDMYEPHETSSMNEIPGRQNRITGTLRRHSYYQNLVLFHFRGTCMSKTKS